ncbi:MAG TPA: hypothetical protein VF571_12055 [Pyrinomonadaceae bacterium]|jgi:hypothetical protein
MKILKRFHYLSFQMGVLIGVIIAFTLSSWSIKNSGFFLQKNSEWNSLLTEGYNFRKIRNSNISWRGPNLGERINLLQLKNSDGRSLAETVNTSYIMLITIDPECGYCRVSDDLMNSVREGLKPINIEYYPISFTSFDDSSNIDKFAISLGFQSKTFTWAKDSELPQESLQNIVTPSHLLLDNTGKVLQVWAGSNREKDIRKRISQQIIADTIILNDTLTALEQK